jgi:hypothetical protein
MSGPSSPFIEVVKPIPGGLNISWRTDVNSKQEKYVVIYTRNDTDRSVFFLIRFVVVISPQQHGPILPGVYLYQSIFYKLEKAEKRKKIKCFFLYVNFCSELLTH